MSTQTQGWSDVESPFHEGEKALQERAGKREMIEMQGRRAIRPFLPDQHRAFYAQLPFISVGHVDADGWPWASILAGKPGFMDSPDEKTLTISARPFAGDPLGDAMKSGTQLGLLGLEFASRRRNRLNARITEAGEAQMTLTVDQSFGNCPQYIQTRGFEFTRDPLEPDGPDHSERIDRIDAAATVMIEKADTFFVASAAKPGGDARIEGADVSHRGGRPGFVRVEGNTLTIPDYSGNLHFNTLGNFHVNPKAGLLFADFEYGDILMLTGTVEVIWDGPEVEAFRGAERLWRFTLDHGHRLPAALPMRWTFREYSPNTMITGDWAQTLATLEAEAERNAWKPYRVAGVQRESSVIRSLFLEPEGGGALPSFEPGQYLTVRTQLDADGKQAVRTYTVSSAPADQRYRISVKREPAAVDGEPGLVSNHLHDHLQVGDVIEAKAPRGQFALDAAETRPAVLLAGGVGITPMMSMLRHIAQEGVRTRHARPVVLIHSAKSTDQRAFFDEARQLSEQSGGAIRYFSLIGQPLEHEKIGQEFNGQGRINAVVLRQILPLDDYDFYLCGPSAFMQDLYDTLRSLGVRDARINAESFGPASLKRRRDEAQEGEEVTADEAEDALIGFAASGLEQRWSSDDGTLLDFAEAQGLTPDFGCRSGACGTCAVKLTKGEVTYRTKPSIAVADDEALICCAVPARDGGDIELEL